MMRIFPPLRIGDIIKPENEYAFRPATAGDVSKYNRDHYDAPYPVELVARGVRWRESINREIPTGCPPRLRFLEAVHETLAFGWSIARFVWLDFCDWLGV